MSGTDGGSAFPVPMVFDGSVCDTVNEHGMTLRDYFAAQALAGIMADHTWEQGPDDTAKAAYVYADAMLKERAK